MGLYDRELTGVMMISSWISYQLLGSMLGFLRFIHDVHDVVLLLSFESLCVNLFLFYM